jgi:hypothetical protein
VAVEQDVETDLPVANSARDPFDTPVQEDEYRPTIVIERNRSTHNAALAQSVRNTVNASAITVAGILIGERQGLIKQFGARAAYENGTTFVRERIVIELAPSHVRYVLDRGFRVLTPAAVPGPTGVTFQIPGKALITDQQGLPITSPELLDGGGGILPEGSPPVFLEFNTKRAASWAGLNLPTTFPDT